MEFSSSFLLYPLVGEVAQAHWVAAGFNRNNGRRDADRGFSLFTFGAGGGYDMSLYSFILLPGHNRAVCLSQFSVSVIVATVGAS